MRMVSVSVISARTRPDKIALVTVALLRFAPNRVASYLRTTSGEDPLW